MEVITERKRGYAVWFAEVRLRALMCAYARVEDSDRVNLVSYELAHVRMCMCTAGHAPLSHASMPTSLAKIASRLWKGAWV